LDIPQIEGDVSFITQDGYVCVTVAMEATQEHITIRLTADAFTESAWPIEGQSDRLKKRALP
jgi:hypothetical protein